MIKELNDLNLFLLILCNREAPLTVSLSLTGSFKALAIATWLNKKSKVSDQQHQVKTNEKLLKVIQNLGVVSCAVDFCMHEIT